MNKRLTVSSGPRSNPVSTQVELNGVLPGDRLMPRMARRAARVAFGGDAQMTVWDHEYDYGYRLYKNSARKLKPELPHPAREGAGSGEREE